MNVRNYSPILAVLAMLLFAGAARAQNPPTIGYVYPAGGRQGTTVQVTVGGQFLRGVKGAVISGRLIQAKVLEHVGPLPQKQVDELREQVKELQQRRQAALRPDWRRFRDAASQPASQPAWTDEDEQTLVATVERLETFARTRIMPAFGDTVTLEVTIGRDAVPGLYDLRLETAERLTNPMVFCVGTLPEVGEPVAKGGARFGIADDRPARRFPARPADAPGPVDITLPTVINGQILAGDRDTYRFAARKGHRIVAVVQARRLLPYMADGVPGWFQSIVTVYDAKGEELACADHYRFDPDPVLSFEVLADGQYTMEIADALYRGREDFVYRVSIGELPFVTSVFPLGGRAGTPTSVQLSGWNLPATRVVFNGSGRSPGIYTLSNGPEALLRSVPFAVDDLPECLETEPNDDLSRAQPVTLPVIVNGRIGQPGEWDVFAFQGRAGEPVVAEVLARRLGSPLDSALKITDAAGKEIASNDDFADKAIGLMTHHADSWLMAKLPAAGTYYVHVCDIQRKAGPEYAYRLRIGPPRPDFDLRISPSGIAIRPGETAALTAHAIRRDGFDGPIVVSLKDTQGFVLSGATIPPGQDQVRFTLTAPQRLSSGSSPLNFEGRASVGVRQIVRPATPTDDRMQAFAYRHLVPADQFLVCASDRPFPRNQAQIFSQTPVRIFAGGQGVLEVSLPTGPRAGRIQAELSDPPEGIRVQHTTSTRTGLRILLAADGDKAKPGLGGNLILTIFAERAGGEGQPNRRRIPLGTLPAVPFVVTARP